jgi:putative transposase
MKRKRYTEEQIIGILKAHEAGAKVSNVIRQHGVFTAGNRSSEAWRYPKRKD